MKRKVQKQKQRQSQSVKVIVNLPEKKPRRKRTYKPKKSPTEVEQESQMFRQLPPVVYMTPPQVTNYLMPKDTTTPKITEMKTDAVPIRPRITEMKPVENPRASLEDINPLEFFKFGDEFPEEKEIKIVTKEAATSPILEMKPAPAKSSILEMKPAPSKSAILDLPAFETQYSKEYKKSESEFEIVPVKPKRKKASKKAKEPDVPIPVIAEEVVSEMPILEGKKVSGLNILAARSEKQPNLERFGFTSETEPIKPAISAKITKGRGRPSSGKYPNLGNASKEMLTKIYKNEFGKDVDPSMKRDEILDYIKANTRAVV